MCVLTQLLIALSLYGTPYGALYLEGGSGGHGSLRMRYSSICDHTFGKKEGDVACRQMGYTRAVAVRKNSL